MSDHAEVIRFLDELAARAQGDDPDPAFDRRTATPVPSAAIGPFSEARRNRAHHLTLAAETAHMGGVVGPGAKLPHVRAAIAKASHPVAAYQVAYNHEVLAAFDALDDELDRRHDHVFGALRTLGHAVDDTHEATRALAERVDTVERTTGATDERQAAVEAAVASLQHDVAALRARVDVALAHLDALGSGTDQ